MKGKTEAEIRSAIRRLKNEFGRLKNIMEHPEYGSRFMVKSVNYSGMNQNNPILSPHPKSDAGIREVMMLDCLANRLKDMAEGQPTEYFIFGGAEPLTKSALRKRWQKYQKETDTTFTPHQLRHAYATILYDAGIDEKVAQGLMGHSTIQLTRDIYTHVRMNRKEMAAKTLNKYINEKRQSV